jgi:hypothetical protein
LLGARADPGPTLLALGQADPRSGPGEVGPTWEGQGRGPAKVVWPWPGPACGQCTCIAERSFSMSAQTDDKRRRRMHKLKFGGLQKLRAGYLDGRISVESEILRKYIGDFEFDDDDYAD